MKNEKENPVTVAAVHGAKRKKAGENLQVNNTANTSRCQSAAAQRRRILGNLKFAPLTTFGAKGKTPSTRQRIKRLLVWLACRGFIPIIVAEWLIHQGGLRHA